MTGAFYEDKSGDHHGEATDSWLRGVNEHGNFWVDEYTFMGDA